MLIEDQCEETEIMSKSKYNQRPECELQKNTGVLFMLSLEYFHTGMFLVWSAMQFKHFGVLHDIIKQEWKERKNLQKFSLEKK